MRALLVKVTLARPNSASPPPPVAQVLHPRRALVQQGQHPPQHAHGPEGRVLGAGSPIGRDTGRLGDLNSWGLGREEGLIWAYLGSLPLLPPPPQPP